MIDLAKFKLRYPDFEEADALMQMALDDANNIIQQYQSESLPSAEQIGADIAVYRLVNKSDTYAAEKYEGIYKNAMKQLEQHYKQSQAPTAPQQGKQTIDMTSSKRVFGRGNGGL